MRVYATRASSLQPQEQENNMGDNPVGWLIGATLCLTVVILSVLIRAHLAIQRIEGILNALVKQSGIDPLAVAAEEATKLAKEGKKIGAIKAYRNFTGCGLAEAKMRVEAMM